MRHTLTGKPAQTPRRAHHLLDASIGLAVYDGAIHVATTCVGDGSYSVSTVSSKLIGRSATAHSTPNANANALEIGFVLMSQQDVIEVAWDLRSNLLPRQSRGYGGDHELDTCRDYFPRFLDTVGALRELIADAIRKDRAL